MSNRPAFDAGYIEAKSKANRAAKEKVWGGHRKESEEVGQGLGKITVIEWPELPPTAAEKRAAKPTAKQSLQALGRLKTGEKNKTESAYGDVLEARKQAGEVAWYKFEGIKFRLADDTFYSPDYAVMLSTGEMEIHECKGFWTDDAKVKIKVAASLYPFRFIAVQKLPKKKGGGWKVIEF